MRILLVDTMLYYPSSPLFAEALAELAARGSWSWAFVDENGATAGTGRRAISRTILQLPAARMLRRRAFNREILAVSARLRPDVVLVTKGATLAPETLLRLKRETGAFLINYATDDPFNPRVSSRELREGIPHYDLYACTKRRIMEDVRRAGCENVTYTAFGYKPSIHFPEAPSTTAERRLFESDVVFIGGADDDRIPYFEGLVAEMPGVKLRLFGGYWNRHRSLKRYHQGFARGRDYRLAVGGAKIVINLVRRSNRDGHVMRTFEVPACGGFMLAERTDEHLELFGEDRESVFFGTSEEMVAKIRRYLNDEPGRKRIAEAGCTKIRGGSHRYVDRLSQLLAAADVADLPNEYTPP